MRLTNKTSEHIKRKMGSAFIYKIYKRRQLLDKVPYAMNIEITTRCNLKCWMCPRPKHKNVKSGDIDFYLFKKTVDEMTHLLTKKTTFTPVGLGEPLFYNKLLEAIEYLKIKCPNVPIHIDTNATLLDEEKSEMLCRLLCKNDRILFSLNAGSRNTYEWMMGVDKFDLVVSNIKNFLEIREKIGKGPRVIIQIMDTKKTASEIEGFKNFWKYFIGPSDSIYVRPLLNWGGKIETKDICTQVKRKRYPCLSPWIAVVIDINGNVYPCCEALSTRENGNLLLGNIQRNSLLEIYSQDKIRQIRENMLNNQNSISECSNCDFWSFYSNIWFNMKGRWR
ncbi:MAG TPA: radical SAM protein [bacterium]|nr:radical SAM protein [bacterium]